jgi:hypothetical protein
MDTFSEPYTRQEDASSLEDVRAAVSQLEYAQRAKGVALSGRIVHVVHYLPVISAITNKSGSSLLSPPVTPEPRVSPSSMDYPERRPLSTEPVWTLGPRSGHAAMISGIRSLSTTHEQVIIGWTGDIETGVEGQTIPTDSLTDTDKKALEDSLELYKNNEHEEGSKPIIYKAVWLKDRIAHAHYEGYCKQSESSLSLFMRATGILICHDSKPSGLYFTICSGKMLRQNVPPMTRIGRPMSSPTQLLRKLFSLCTAPVTLSGFTTTTCCLFQGFSVSWCQTLTLASLRILRFPVLKYFGVYRVGASMQ